MKESEQIDTKSELSHEELLDLQLMCEVERLDKVGTWQKHMNQPEINISTLSSYIKTGKEEKVHSI